MGNEKQFFCCCSLKEGLNHSARIVLVITCFSSALSIAGFFQVPTDGSQSRVLYFLIACYSVLYCAISRGLIRGIEEDRKDKILLWIVFTVVTIILLLTGSIYEFAGCWSNFEELPTKTWMLAFAVAFLLLAFVLLYFTWGAILLWKFLHSTENYGTVV